MVPHIKTMQKMIGGLGTPARRRRRTKPQDAAHRRRCIDYYVRTHSIESLAAMLVDLEWSEGHVPAEE